MRRGARMPGQAHPGLHVHRRTRDAGAERHDESCWKSVGSDTGVAWCRAAQQNAQHWFGQQQVRGTLPSVPVSLFSSMGTRRDHPLRAALGLLVLVAALVFVAPGALLTFAAERCLRLHLDVGQRWTWAIAVSVVAACAMSLRSRRGSDGLGRYALLAAVASAVVLAARFGAHSPWASEMLSEYVP